MHHCRASAEGTPGCVWVFSRCSSGTRSFPRGFALENCHMSPSRGTWSATSSFRVGQDYVVGWNGIRRLAT